MEIRTYQMGNRGIRIGLLTDFHNEPCEKIIPRVAALAPDIIAVAGDLTLDAEKSHRVEDFLTACCRIAPTYVSLGNHDSGWELANMTAAAGAVLLDDSYADIVLKGQDFRIGGLTSPGTHRRNREERRSRNVNTARLDGFCDTAAYKILLCHQPEFYPRYLAHRSIDLVLSGHAHGGQWRIPFTNQGIFAPGQGLFPKLTGGVIENRLVISRGLCNTSWIPRFFNPTEIVMVEL